jgi:hypothetical protein
MHAEDSERGLRLEITIGARGEEEVERVEKAKKTKERRRNFHFISRISPCLPYTEMNIFLLQFSIFKDSSAMLQRKKSCGRS